MIKAINRFEGAQAKGFEDTIMIDGLPDSIFTFQHNYYFMMGDKRHDSTDSRKWGLVPEKSIIGKASMIWFSKEKDKGIRWNRILNYYKPFS